MTPTLVTPPTGDLVTLAEMRAHLRVDGPDDDQMIAAYTQAAIAHLDGWTGILGRAILPQTYREEFTAPGPHVLALPDATVDSATVDGDPVTVAAKTTACGVQVTADGVTGTVVVEYTAALPAHLLPVARHAVMLLVGHWFHTREAVVAGQMGTVPMAAEALIGAIRWRRL